MLKVIASLIVPFLLKGPISIDSKCRPALAPPTGKVLVSAWDAPALSEMKKAEDGMLCPAPSVKAEVELAK